MMGGRDAVIDLDKRWNLLYVVYVERENDLVRAYIGQGLRPDLERLDGDTVSIFIESLKRHGVSDAVIREALSEVA